MAIVYAASLPHSPLFVPSVGKDNTEKLEETLTAMEDVRQHMMSAKPDVVLIISPHVQSEHSGLILNIRPNYLAEYESFGDFSTRFRVTGSPKLANTLKRPFNAQRGRLPLVVASEEHLDVGYTTILPTLLKEQEELPIIPLGAANLKPAQAFAFGQLLGPILLDDPSRWAIIASANLSHRLSNESPAGFSPRAKAFDDRTRQAIRAGDAARLAHVRAETIREVSVCGLEPLLILFGLLQGSHVVVHESSYQAPFGIGLPVFTFAV